MATHKYNENKEEVDQKFWNRKTGSTGLTASSRFDSGDSGLISALFARRYGIRDAWQAHTLCLIDSSSSKNVPTGRCCAYLRGLGCSCTLAHLRSNNWSVTLAKRWAFDNCATTVFPINHSDEALINIATVPFHRSSYQRFRLDVHPSAKSLISRYLLRLDLRSELTSYQATAFGRMESTNKWVKGNMATTWALRCVGDHAAPRRDVVPRWLFPSKANTAFSKSTVSKQNAINLCFKFLPRCGYRITRTLLHEAGVMGCGHSCRALRYLGHIELESWSHCHFASIFCF